MSKLQSATIADLTLRLMRDERGTTAIEYAILASGVAVAIAATIMNLGGTVKGLFTSVATAME
jgi:pilus assembly protein Flp/PilA